MKSSLNSTIDWFNYINCKIYRPNIRCNYHLLYTMYNICQPIYVSGAASSHVSVQLAHVCKLLKARVVSLLALSVSQHLPWRLRTCLPETLINVASTENIM